MAQEHRPRKLHVKDFAHTGLGVVTAVKLELQAVDLVADAAGMSSAQTACPIERCCRDAHTASQHVLLNTAHFGVGAVGAPCRIPGDLSSTARDPESRGARATRNKIEDFWRRMSLHVTRR
ncbi:MAG: hypothetical protein WA740_05675 [Candidatus Binataceae bacterium]